MARILPVLVAGLLTVAIPVGAQSLPQDDQDDSASTSRTVELTDTELFSAMAGNIVGAATACKDIDHDRVSNATDKVASLVDSTSADEKEQSLSKILFLRSVGGGRAAVRSGEVDCGMVDSSLTKLEQFAQRAAGATNSGGSE